jgi:hypothetical protein
MRHVTVIKTNDGAQFDRERDAIRYLQGKAEPLLRNFLRDFETLPSFTTKLLFLQDNAKSMQKILDLMHELNAGLIEEH